MNLCAGEFIQIDNKDKEAPTLMRIFVSHSKQDLVQSEEIFRIIKLGVACYEDLFGVKFPFSKYD
jgi:hypothetical protein